MPADLRVSITDAEGAGAYPLSGFSWVLVRKDIATCTRAVPLLRYLWWAVHEGQQFAEPLHYAPLPEAIVKLDEAKLKAVTCEGRPALPE
jgi:phosphate transport system substrate-binding protein